MSSLQMADQLVAMWLEDRKQACQWVHLNCEGPRRVLDALERAAFYEDQTSIQLRESFIQALMETA